MPNKTIYIKDEALWAKAKKFAGKGGLSEVITEGLQRYVADSEANAAGQETVRFVVQWDERAPERVAFRGHKLASMEIDRPNDGLTLHATVWETQGGKFVFAVRAHEGWVYFAAHDTLREVAEDRELPGDVSSDVEEWIHALEIGRAEMGSAETWID